MKFDRCHGCGACCMAVGDILATPLEELDEEFREDVKNFPHGVDENGWCEKLDADMNCTVYENRPLLCRVDSHYNGRPDNKKDHVEYYDEIEESCKYLMKEKLGMNDEDIDLVYTTLRLHSSTSS